LGQERETTGREPDAADRSDRHVGELGALGELIQYGRERLQEGGPQVNFDALYAFIDRDLPKEDLLEVRRQINKWKAWYDAYWEIQTSLGCGTIKSDEWRIIVLIARPSLRTSARTYHKGGDEVPASGEEPVEWELSTRQGEREVSLPTEIAEFCYDVPEQKVTFLLHQVPIAGAPDFFEPQVEVAPAPRKNALWLEVTFLTGDHRTLFIPVPRRTRHNAFSQSCDPAPASAFGRNEWDVRISFVDAGEQSK
jgi:hypothetical protein